MTGTAATEAAEFGEIYKLDVVVDPDQHADGPQGRGRRGLPHRAREERGHRRRDRGRAPRRASRSLVGTVSIEKSEQLSALLKAQGRPAPGAERPLPRAGGVRSSPRPAGSGAVTIATNMAGRGTDIQLGGNADMRIAAGAARARSAGAGSGRRHPARGRGRAAEGPRRRRPLRLGTERHESRRIDNQLRGRSGRQGDPGRSKFFLSLEDDLMRIFGSRAHGRDAAAARPQGRRGDRPSLDQQGAREGAAEGRGAQLRDPQAAAQVRRRDERPAQGRLRAAPRADRGRATSPTRCATCATRSIDDLVATHMPEKAYPEQWDVERPDRRRRSASSALDLPVADWAKEEGIAEEEIRERRVTEASDRAAGAQGRDLRRAELMRMAEKSLLLQILDHLWKEHLLHLDHLRQGIHLRGYGQRDPLNEYKREAFDLFEAHADQPAAHGDPGAGAPRDPDAPSRNPPPPPRAAPQRAGTRRGARAAGHGRRRRLSSVDPRRPLDLGQRSSATPPAPAAPAGSTSSATAGWPEPAGLITFTLRAGPARRMIGRTNCSAPGMP